MDIEPKNASWTFPCDHVVIGDAAVSLSQLIDCIRDLGAPAGSVLEARMGRLIADRKDYGFFDDPESISEVTPLYPQRIISEIRSGIHDDAIVTCDAGENRLFMTHWFQTLKAGTLLMPASTGAMGYAVPAALAAKLAFPDRRVVAVNGDGGFPMAMNGLITACEEKIPITTIIFNNSRLGWVGNVMGENRISSDFPDVNYADIAKTMGCRGYRIEGPGELEKALVETEDSDVPVVLDVVTSTKFTFRDVSSQF
jgi:acetolactate synthase-1/2/3 large subunit